jgi:hypothetical protein
LDYIVKPWIKKEGKERGGGETHSGHDV